MKNFSVSLEIDGLCFWYSSTHSDQIELKSDHYII